MTQLNDSLEIEEYQHYIKIDKKTQDNSPGDSGRCENNFMQLDHQDNSLQRSLRSFQTHYYIILRNSEI